MKVEINNETYEAKKDQTILELAKENNIHIPHLCHDPDLSVSGSCRMCIVKLKDRDQIVTACSTPIQEGMKVSTNDEEVEKKRENVLDLILADHEINCIKCEADGDCQIQNLAYEYDMEESSYSLDKKEREGINDNPFIELDPKKCVLCGKCVKACDEIQSSSAISFLNRGFETKVGAPMDEDLDHDYCECVFCGLCVEKCPTNALSYKPSKRKGRDYQLNETRTSCPYCGVGCQLNIKTNGDEIARVEAATKGNPPNPKGRMCVKGRFGNEYVNNEDRITKPLIKRDGKFVEVSWDEALKYITDRFEEIREEHGADSIAGLSSAKCTNEENYLMQKLMRGGIGTNNVDHCARLCHSSTVAGLKKALGSGAMTNSISEVEESDVIFVIGSNPTENHPVIGSKIKKAKREGAELIVADPREIELAKISDIHIGQRPGTDTILVNALLKVIIEEDLIDEEFIEERTENFEEVKETVKNLDLKTVESVTGVPKEKIKQAAKKYGSGNRSSIYYAMGITQHKNGTDNVLSLANLAMATGNLGKEGTGVNPLRGQNNVQGACDLGALPNVYSGYQSVEDKDVRQKFEDNWGTELPDESGLTVVEIFNEANKGNIKSLYIMGENPMISDPDQNHVEEALEEIDFLVVQDLFITETAEYADVILPGSSYAEKEGTFTNTERRIQKIRNFIEPKGNSKPDWEILCEIGKKFGLDMDYEDPAEVMDEIAELTPIYGGIHHDRLGTDGLQWPCTGRDNEGTKYLYRDEFARDNGKGRFHVTEYLEPVESPDEEYGFTMMTGRMLYHFHSGTMSRRSEAIDAHEPDSYIEMNKADASELRISNGDKVRVKSRRGEIETFARVNNRVQEGQVFMPFHYEESPANRLTSTELDPKAKIPELKVTAVSVEKT